MASASGLRINPLGQTGIKVTQLCMGALPIGPSQYNAPVDEGAAVIAAALDAGVNFVDTAQGYRTYPYIRPALAGRSDKVVVASKSLAASYEDMRAAVKEALEQLDVDHLAIFHLHAARVTPEVFQDRAAALRCLVEAKRAGLISAVGVSTHSVTVTRAAAERDDIDVIFPILNLRGLGILHGTRDDMEAAVRYAAAQGKGLYAMKTLGGGNLLDDMRAALDYAMGIKEFAALAVGMVTRDEVEMNVRIFSGQARAPTAGEVAHTKKLLRVMSFCQGCGTCVQTCPNMALSLVDGRAVIDRSRCLLCGYCAPVCPQFAIRLV